MNILSLENISKQFGDRPLFEQVTFGLSRGERVGVIGVNGSGKTTLLRIVAGQELPDTGRVVLSQGIKVAYLPQVPELDDTLTVLDAVFAGDSPRIRLLHDYEQISTALAQSPHDIELLDRLNTLTTQMDALGAWDAETAAHTIISQLGLSNVTSQPVHMLSGGQRRRVAMAQALIEAPDLVILDEPTNHIDTETIAWLEDYLARSSMALLVVTHDRYFLDRVVMRMIELDRGRVTTYSGNYGAFLEQKATREVLEQTEEDARQNLLRKELAWLRRGARGRTTKQKAHVQRVYDLIEQKPDAAQSTVDIDLGSRRIGKRVLELEHISKRYGERTLITDFSLSLRRDDRIGIIGPNGSGKSTLLNLIAERIQPDTGAIIRGETIHLAYYDQESTGLNETQRVIDYIRDGAELMQTGEGALASAAQMLERFLFSRDTQWALIGTLSGGERRRLYLLRTLMFAPNVLLLDEPTNDLDIQTLTILEDYLDTFQGAVIVVSHDRYFLDRTVQRLLAFEHDGVIREYPGGYTIYEEYRAQNTELQATPAHPTTVMAASRDAGPRRLSYKEQRELTHLEERIATLEAQKTRIETELNTAGSDFQVYQRLADNLAQINADLETTFNRWAELAELEE